MCVPLSVCLSQWEWCLILSVFCLFALRNVCFSSCKVYTQCMSQWVCLSVCLCGFSSSVFLTLFSASLSGCLSLSVLLSLWWCLIMCLSHCRVCLVLSVCLYFSHGMCVCLCVVSLSSCMSFLCVSVCFSQCIMISLNVCLPRCVVFPVWVCLILLGFVWFALQGVDFPGWLQSLSMCPCLFAVSLCLGACLSVCVSLSKCVFSVFLFQCCLSLWVCRSNCGSLFLSLCVSWPVYFSHCEWYRFFVCVFLPLYVHVSQCVSTCQFACLLCPFCFSQCVFNTLHCGTFRMCVSYVFFSLSVCVSASVSLFVSKPGSWCVCILNYVCASQCESL